MNIDTTTATGTLMLNIFASVAQLERDQMLARQRVGIEAAKLADKGKPLAERSYKGQAHRTRQSCKRSRLARSRP
jgi:DNA invertase Pin-like site-specific DNA recombinase